MGMRVLACFAWCVGLTAAWAAAEPPLRAALRAAPRIQISAGWFTMGSDDDQVGAALRMCLSSQPDHDDCSPELFDDEQPAHRVHLSAFSIDRSEVSNAAYQQCVLAGACAPCALAESDERIGLPQHPVTQIRWADARAYCRFRSGDLPTEAQWEYAAHGDSRRAFPWGDVWNSRIANHAQREHGESTLDGYEYAAPVDAYPSGKSFFGALNMGGNVWEWVLDRFAGPYASRQAAIDPQGASTGNERVIRGGSWRTPAYALRARFRGHMPQDQARPDVGFRCAYGAR